MNNLAGTGVLLTEAEEIPVGYDLVQVARSRDGPLEGQVFGEPDALRGAAIGGVCDLRLEDGGLVRLAMLGVDTHGAANVRVAGPLRRDE